MPKEPEEVARILFKEIVEGDRRKIEAQSNDADTGGGARDFRFGNYPNIRPAIEKMFAARQSFSRKRNGRKVLVQVMVGRLHWMEGDKLRKQDSFFEPPTDVRPSEGRLTKVHEIPCFAANRIPQVAAGKKVLLLLVQRYDGTVWPSFITEESLDNDAWDVNAREVIRNCIQAQRPATRSVIGFHDFEHNQSYCNGQ